MVTEMTVPGEVAGRIHVAAGGILVLAGTAHGGVVVTHGGYACIAGRTEGLFVAVGGHAVLAGTCQGAAVNDGGCLHIEGTLDGPLLDYAGDTTVSPAATVAEATIVRIGHHERRFSFSRGRLGGHPIGPGYPIRHGWPT
ncbi:MAG TPA: hypothetical protein VGL49_01490 [Acidimicrobiales bacterium]